MIELFTWLVWLLCLLTGLMLLFSDRYNKLQWISPLRWFGIIFFILHVLMPFNILYFRDSLGLNFAFSDYILMAMASVVGGLCFWLGWQSKRTLLKISNPVPKESIDLPFQRIIQILLLSPISILSLAILSNAYGSLLEFAIMPQEAYDLIGQDFFNIFSLIFASFVPLIILNLKQFQTSHGFQKIFWSFSGLALLILYLFISTKLGSRYRLLFIIMPMSSVYLSTLKTRGSFKSLLLLVCSCIIFYLIGRIRYQLVLIPGDLMTRITEYFSELDNGLYVDILMSGDFDAFQNGMILLSLVPYIEPLLWGSTFLSILYNPIPRFIWPGKPSPAVNQYMIDKELGPASIGNDNFAVSLIAELYANFWWLGIIFGMFLIGILAAKIWNWFLFNRHRYEAWFHIGLFCAYLLVLTRGSFHSMTAYYLMVVVNEIATRKIASLCIKIFREIKHRQIYNSRY